MSNYIIKLKDEDLYSAILMSNLACEIDNINFTIYSNIIFDNKIEDLSKKFPKFQSRFATLKLLKIEENVLYCYDATNFKFYIMISDCIINDQVNCDPVKDTISNLNEILDLDSDNMIQKGDKIYKNYRELKLEYINYEFITLGYSKGANISEWLGFKDETILVTSFCPTFYDFNLVNNRHYPNITRYILKDDILGSKLRQEQQNEYPVTSKSFKNLKDKLVYCHDISNFTHILDDYEIINNDQIIYLEDDFPIKETKFTNLINTEIKLWKRKLLNNKLKRKKRDLIRIVNSNENNTRKKQFKPCRINDIPPLIPSLPPTKFSNTLYTGFNSSRSTSFRSSKIFNSNNIQPNLHTSFYPSRNTTNYSIINSLSNISPKPYNEEELKYKFSNDQLYL